MNKIFAAALEIETICRDKDWLDVEGIIERQGAGLDRELIWSELLPLLELRDDPTLEQRLRALFARRR